MRAHRAYAQSVLARDEVAVEHTGYASPAFVLASPRAHVHKVGLFRFENIVHDHSHLTPCCGLQSVFSACIAHLICAMSTGTRSAHLAVVQVIEDDELERAVRADSRGGGAPCQGPGRTARPRRGQPGGAPPLGPRAARGLRRARRARAQSGRRAWRERGVGARPWRAMYD
jgi:hypothetical protein